MTDLVRIGTRRSTLAMYQTHLIRDLLLSAHPGLTVEIVDMDTKGDKIQGVPLPQIGGKGLFTQELEDQLLTEDIELAVHSLKDLPSQLPEGLIYAGSPARGNPTDAFVSRTYDSLEAVPSGATIATGSVRRRAQLAHRRPDLHFVDLRGNIETRLRKLDDNGWAGIMMATTALERLEMHDRITEALDPGAFVPAVSQGAIGVEIKGTRDDVQALLDPIFDALTMQAVRAERAFMRALEGGCSAPVAAHARLIGDTWIFDGFVSSPDGTQALHESTSGPDPLVLANAMSADFLAKGAADMMRA